MECLIARKIDFLSQFQLLLDEIKVLASNYNFEKLILSNQGFNCIIIEVWWPIRDLIENNPKPKIKPEENATIKGPNYNLSRGLITRL